MDENLHHRPTNFPLFPGYSQQARNRQWHFGFPELSYLYRYCSCKSHLPVLGININESYLLAATGYVNSPNSEERLG
jgi:hypothetical protein